MKRIFDLFLAFTALIILLIPMTGIGMFIALSTRSKILYWSKRVGKNNHLFLMPKFRTMRPDTPQVATHLLDNPDQWLTPVGRFLRAHSLDELPQLWTILKGEMSFVGPRPALFNQEDLIKLRTEKGVHTLVPGLTGWAQINGRDELPIEKKAKLDGDYVNHMSLTFDIKIFFQTISSVLRHKGVKEGS